MRATVKRHRTIENQLQLGLDDALRAELAELEALQAETRLDALAFLEEHAMRKAYKAWIRAGCPPW
jgi:hypothetical protein